MLNEYQSSKTSMTIRIKNHSALVLDFYVVASCIWNIRLLREASLVEPFRRLDDLVQP